MTDDLVARARDASERIVNRVMGDGSKAGPMMSIPADEKRDIDIILTHCADRIEALESIVNADDKIATIQEMGAEIEVIRAENERLRDELRKLLNLTVVELAGTGNEYRQPWKRRVERARAALQETTNE